MTLCPVSLREARAFVTAHHRHHRAPQGGLFAIAAEDPGYDGDGPSIVAVAIVGMPVARQLADGYTAEVTRLCALENFPNACSMLYAAAWRAARAMGYRRLVTYTLPQEGGASLRGAGFRLVGEAGGGSLVARRQAAHRHAPDAGEAQMGGCLMTANLIDTLLLDLRQDIRKARELQQQMTEAIRRLDAREELLERLRTDAEPVQDGAGI